MLQGEVTRFGGYLEVRREKKVPIRVKTKVVSTIDREDSGAVNSGVGNRLDRSSPFAICRLRKQGDMQEEITEKQEAMQVWTEGERPGWRGTLRSISIKVA